MIRTTILSTMDGRGGAAIAAYRLHQALGRGGVQSRMCVAKKSSGDDTVVALPEETRWERFRRRFQGRRVRREWRSYRASRPAGGEYFSDDRIPGADRLGRAMPKADVYNIHWVAGLVDYTRLLGNLPRATPLVWTLHDMNPFTGGCHYAMDCRKFTATCGACPQLGSTDPADLSAAIHGRKTAAYATLEPDTTRIVAPSRWLAGEARRSRLFSRFDAVAIPNSVDVDAFRPGDRGAARARLGLPADEPVVLFVADDVRNRRKGLDLLLAALDPVCRHQPVTLAVIGQAPEALAASAPLVSLGRLDDLQQLVTAYVAADLFVVPTRADNLPNVVLEAMACGTPVVGFDVGGVPEMVESGVSGLLAPPEDVAGLAAAITTLLDDVGLRSRMAAAGRARVLADYTYAAQAGRYVAVFEQLLEASRRLRAAPKGAMR